MAKKPEIRGLRPIYVVCAVFFNFLRGGEKKEDIYLLYIFPCPVSYIKKSKVSSLYALNALEAPVCAVLAMKFCVQQILETAFSSPNRSSVQRRI